ncbi:MAG: efflux RND transporter permease subunit [Candidatus Aminicenantales bacterium]
MKIFIERPVATAMCFLALLVLGIYSFLHTPLELAPKEDFPQVDIQAEWYGVPPETIQTRVTSVLEEVCASVKRVKKITSESGIGRARITLEFDAKANMEFALLALREELAKARRKLPYGVQPVVFPYVPEDFRVSPFLSYTVSGDYPLQKLREIVKDKVEFGLGSVKGISRVEVSGGSDPEIRIILDKKKLKAFGIHPFQVTLALHDRARTYPTGKVKKGTQEYLLKVSDVVHGLAEMGETIVAYSGRRPVYLKDLARIIPAYGDVHAINRINGKPTVNLSIAKEKGENTLQVARAVKTKLAHIQKELPPDLIFTLGNDESGEIHKNLNSLYLLAGLIILVIFALIFGILRRVKPALLILSSIAFSMVITFNLIYVFKISLNMLTLGALALGFGTFVDNSIVVFENILRLREKGVPPLQAAVQAPREVFIAVLASTLTTMSVFLCFPYFQGRLKIYYLPLAFIISSALAASFLVSFSLIPALSPKLVKRSQERPKGKMFRFYDQILRRILRHPLEIILILAAMLYGSYKWFKSEVTIGTFFPWYSKNILYVSVGMPPGADIATTDEVIRKFEEKVLEADYAKEMDSFISSERANIRISFPPSVENSFHPYLLKEELIRLATQFAGITIGVSGFDPQFYYSPMDAGTYYSSRIKLNGYNLKKLREITAGLEKTLRRNPRIKEVRIVSSQYGWWRGDSYENILKLNKESMRKYSIDPQYLYFHLQTLLEGRFGTLQRVKIGGREVALNIKFPEAEAMDLQGLLDSLIRTQSGEYLRVREIASLTEKPIAGSIDRENQQFQQTVMWEFRGPQKAEEKYKNAVFNSLHVPPGFSASLEETWLMTGEEKGQIKFAVVFSLIIIFMILASLYESFIHPFVVMLAVPLALIGVFVAFVIADYPFDSRAYIGVILLGGIVVNNAILLVDHINLKRKQGFELLEAVVQGARERVRPIFMTTSTTVFGMLPMLLLQGEAGKRQIWSTFALVNVGGLVSSTFFVLIVIPIFYFYGDRIRFWAHRKFMELQSACKKF